MILYQRLNDQDQPSTSAMTIFLFKSYRILLCEEKFQSGQMAQQKKGKKEKLLTVVSYIFIPRYHVKDMFLEGFACVF